jgi:hypothetical protein
METTNIHNLPEAIYNCLSKNRPPIMGRYSVTDLIGSPLSRLLRMKHYNELEEDVSERLFALLGQSVHYVLEKGSPDNALAEEKLVINYKGIQIAGIADLYHNGIISDFKVVSAFSFLLGEKPEWVRQLNCYAWCYRQLGFDTYGLRIHAILRDWMRSKALREADYPQIPFQTVELPLWDEEEAREYVNSRISKHFIAEESGLAPCCTDEERWMKPTTYAVYKPKLKRASRVLESREEAEEWAIINLGDKYEIRERIGEYTKCLSYCACRMVCPFNTSIETEDEVEQ